MTILYFTATGNCLHVAKELGGNLVSIPKAVKGENYHFKDDKIGIVFPIYGLAVFPYIKEFLAKVQLDSDYIFAIMTYGKFDGGATTHLLEVAKANKINFAYINTLKMVDNYLPIYEMEKQIKNEPQKRINNHLQEIVTAINGQERCIQKDSAIDKLMTKIILKSYSYNTGVGITKKYEIEDTCTKCKICEMLCPTDNIKVDAKPSFGKNCITCLACTQNCPQNAIRLANEKSRARFRNQHIKLTEIMEANG